MLKNKRSWLTLIGLLVVLSLTMAACAQPAPEVPATEEPMEEEAPAAEEPAMEEGLPDLGGREIVIAVENAYPPFNFIDEETGEPSGWDYDAGREICNRLNCVPVFTEAAWDGLFPAMAAGEYDVAFDGITYTEERDETVDFSRPYVTYGQVLLVAAGEDRFTSPDEFQADDALIVATQLGTTNEMVAIDFVGEGRIQSYEDFGLAVSAVLSGDADAVMIDSVSAIGFINENPGKLKMIQPGVTSDEQLALVFPPDSELIAPFDAALDEMEADGTLQAINDKWFNPEVPEEAMVAGPELGTDENPIIWSFVPSGEMERVASGAQAVADLIFDETGLVVETNVATEYAGVIEAMCSDPPEAHMGSLATFAYVLAADRGCADAALVSVRYGSPTYNGQIIVRADSGITSIEDLAGKTFCRPDPLSTSGWIIPMLTMRAAGLDTDTDLAEVVDAGSHDAVAAAVYNGDCDAGATYVDARTTIEEDYPDVMEVVAVLALTEDIPNDGVQFVPSFPADLRDTLVQALLAIADTEAGQEALDTAYSWAGLIEAGDTFYDPFRQVLQASGLSIEELTGE